jgi:hypothetical protein
MNLVMPVDFQAFVPSQESLGTNDARAENGQRDAIASAQGASSSAQSQQNNASGDQQTNNQTSKKASPDKISISDEGKKAAKNEQDAKASTYELSEEEQQRVQELKDRDREVRVHEQAHAAVGGQYAGAPTYQYETGPDNKRYAVGGEVSIDVSEEEKPEDTVQKMQVVRAAALAPAEPSSQDLKVAAEATQKESKARAEMGQNSLNGAEQTKPSLGEANQNKNATALKPSSENSQSTLANAFESSYLPQASIGFSASA